MKWQDYYKLPLKWNKDYPIKVFTADDKMAFDFTCDAPIEWKQKVIDAINGTPQQFNYPFLNTQGYIFYDDRKAIVIRGWGMLTGVGGYKLSPIQAALIQDKFGEWITKQLN